MFDSGAEETPARWPVDHTIWHRVIDADAYGWMLVDAEGVIRYHNDAVAELLGRVGYGALGTSMFDHVASSDVEAALEAVDELSNADESEMLLVGLPMVFRVLHADGSVVPIEVGAESFLDVPGVEAIRLRIRDYRPDACLHAYLEALAEGARFPHLLKAAVRLADATLVGGTTAILHDWDGETYRSVVTDRLPEELTRGIIEADAVDPPWVASRDGDAHIVSCADLGGRLAEQAVAAGLKSCWVEPLTIAEDAVPSAALVIFRPWSQRPLVGHLAAARRLRSTIALAFLAQRARERLMSAATSDSLTGLDNRSAAFDQLERLVASGPTAVLFVDLDGFKAINDSRGHGIGDGVLVEVADMLREAVEPGAVAARIGGDEFLVIVPDAPPVAELTALAEQVLTALCRSIPIDGTRVELGATIGVARFPEHGATPDELVEAADRALYRAKRLGGRSWAVAYADG